LDFLKAAGEVVSAVSKLKSRGKYPALFALFAAAFAAFFVFLPIYLTPGNDFGFWFSIMPWWGYLLLVLFSAIMGLLLTMQLYIHDNRMSQTNAASGGLSLVPALAAGVYSTAACVGCLAALFAFAGLGGVLFFTAYRTQLIVLSVGIALVSLYYTSRRLNRNCESCAVGQVQPG